MALINNESIKNILYNQLLILFPMDHRAGIRCDDPQLYNCHYCDDIIKEKTTIYGCWILTQKEYTEFVNRHCGEILSIGFLKPKKNLSKLECVQMIKMISEKEVDLYFDKPSIEELTVEGISPYFPK